jgi:hypothetical protein
LSFLQVLANAAITACKNSTAARIFRRFSRSRISKFGESLLELSQDRFSILGGDENVDSLL